jgi:hypothetical protein
MDYQVINFDNKRQLLAQRLANLEAEHYNQTLAYDLAVRSLKSLEAACDDIREKLAALDTVPQNGKSPIPTSSG